MTLNQPRALRIAVVWLVLWAAPFFIPAFWLGVGHTLVKESVFFSKTAVMTFGGTYAVQPYLSQQAVEHHHWLAPDQMLDGLGLAETTPGPLITVLQFVGFLGGWNHPDGLPPLLAALMTFMPCFLWVLVDAPYTEGMRGVCASPPRFPSLPPQSSVLFLIRRSGLGCACRCRDRASSTALRWRCLGDFHGDATLQMGRDSRDPGQRNRRLAQSDLRRGMIFQKKRW